MQRYVGMLLFLVAFSVFGVDVSTNVGIDAQWRLTPLQKGGGDNIVKKAYAQGSFYGGVRFNEFFGFELGYQKTDSARRKRKFEDDFLFFNFSEDGFTPDHYLTDARISMQGVYGGLVGILPISETYRLNFISFVGLARLKTEISAREIQVAPTGNILNDESFGFVKKAWVPKISAGIEHKITEHFGVRTTLGWERSAKFNNIQGFDKPSRKPNSLVAKFKNTTTLGAGVFYSF